MKKGFIIVFISVCTISCGKKALSPKEYLTYVYSSDSGLKVEREFNSINYKLQMQTPETLALTNSKNKIKTETDFKNELGYYSNKCNFIFIIEDAAQGINKVKQVMFDKDKYGSVLAYANTELKNDFTLVQGSDTIQCGMVHLEAANSVQPVFRMVLGFNHVDTSNKEITLIYNDNIFNNGPIKFYFPKKLFDNLPEIKI